MDAVSEHGGRPLSADRCTTKTLKTFDLIELSLKLILLKKKNSTARASRCVRGDSLNGHGSSAYLDNNFPPQNKTMRHAVNRWQQFEWNFFRNNFQSNWTRRGCNQVKRPHGRCKIRNFFLCVCFTHWGRCSRFSGKLNRNLWNVLMVAQGGPAPSWFTIIVTAPDRLDLNYLNEQEEYARVVEGTCWFISIEIFLKTKKKIAAIYLSARVSSVLKFFFKYFYSKIFSSVRHRPVPRGRSDSTRCQVGGLVSLFWKARQPVHWTFFWMFHFLMGRLFEIR